MILVAGATGLVGGMITRGLLEQGQEVRILVRPGSNYRELVELGAQPALGDLKIAPSLMQACREVDVVVTTASAGQRGGTDTPQSVDLEGTRNLIEAARQAGVKQFIFVSTVTAAEDSPVPLSRAKAQAERHLRESGLAYTILAANGFMDVMFPLIVSGPLASGKPVTLVGEGRRRHSFVAARDVAAFAVAAVDHPEALNRRIPIGGPKAISWRDVVDTYERVLGRRLQIDLIAPGDLLPHLPPVPGLTQLVSGFMAALETFDSPIEMVDATSNFGVRSTSVEEFVRQDQLVAAVMS